MRFTQVDVFTDTACMGNGLAVVHEADGLTDTQMADFARWTQLSETTFLLAPTVPVADYRVRIFTTGGELPFAGHPTIGSAHAWLGAGGEPAHSDRVIQECGAGLVTVAKGERLAFAAPPLRREGPIDAGDRARLATALGLAEADIVDAAWIDNGPGWMGALLRDADAVRAVQPNIAAFDGLKVGIAGRHSDPDPATIEVRAFYADGRDFAEDAVTGSLNAGLAQWLIGNGTLPRAYIAAQGESVDRGGFVHIEARDGEVWVGGDAVTVITGEVDFGVTSPS